MFTRELSVKILRIVAERDMTLESLSEAAGLSRKFIGNITKERQVPTLDSFEKICTALQLEPNDLLINDKSKSKNKSEAKCIEKLYCRKENDFYKLIPVCPSCQALLKNNWQSYCDNCGQHLCYEKYADAEIILEKPKICNRKGGETHEDYIHPTL